MRKLLLVASIIGAVISTTATAAQAAAPSNDDIGAATAFTDIPYSDAVDTTEATYAATDTACGAATVWYRFTPAVGGQVEFNTRGSNYDTMLALHSGELSDLTVVECNDDSIYGQTSRILADVAAGETYFISAGTSWVPNVPGDVGPGGNLVLTVVVPPPLITSVTLTGHRRGVVDHYGVATLTGTITCDQPASASVYGSLTQRVGRNVARITGFFDLTCGPEPTDFTLQVQSTTGTAFRPGIVRSQGTVTAYDFTGASASSEFGRRIHLRRSHT